MEALSSEHSEPNVTANSHEGLSGRGLVQWALDSGKEACLAEVSYVSTQSKYFRAVARSAGVEWPDGFFESSVEKLMDNR